MRKAAKSRSPPIAVKWPGVIFWKYLLKEGGWGDDFLLSQNNLLKKHSQHKKNLSAQRLRVFLWFYKVYKFTCCLSVWLSTFYIEKSRQKCDVNQTFRGSHPDILGMKTRHFWGSCKTIPGDYPDTFGIVFGQIWEPCCFPSLSRHIWSRQIWVSIRTFLGWFSDKFGNHLWYFSTEIKTSLGIQSRHFWDIW